ncbi:hypothetical protein BDK51DRAFT_44031 [Blyttiomyces helicus]|uniref:Uncharacterized protein n=1 Tax=Blyttiomyces helicus TaxID=388810 RepID=A0A4P9WJC0_9FUNG|nr:hypothetical protein BDK51DRAFT_44031 [Blyttiomyces helicus]|eukprot:RKO92033.1 hypothetical protein BDK51DRAFT_44031 [Blyttiomyces helicus]
MLIKTAVALTALASSTLAYTHGHHHDHHHHTHGRPYEIPTHESYYPSSKSHFAPAIAIAPAFPQQRVRTRPLCDSAKAYFRSTGSPTLIQCAAIACAPGQTREFTRRALMQCDALEKSAERHRGNVRGW